MWAPDSLRRHWLARNGFLFRQAKLSRDLTDALVNPNLFSSY
jgi:hypothetical protein